jgi:hypothetical protein
MSSCGSADSISTIRDSQTAVAVNFGSTKQASHDVYMHVEACADSSRDKEEVVGVERDGLAMRLGQCTPRV